MIHKLWIYKTALMFHIPLIVLLLCCVALIGCPETEQMADNVITPSSENVPPPPQGTEDKPPPPPTEEDKPPPPPQGTEDKPPPPP